MGVGEIAEEMEILGGQEAAAWTGRRWKERGACVVVLDSFLLLSLLRLSSHRAHGRFCPCLREGTYVFEKVMVVCITSLGLFLLLSLLPSLFTESMDIFVPISFYLCVAG
jgi:hypothetical protein